MKTKSGVLTVMVLIFTTALLTSGCQTDAMSTSTEQVEEMTAYPAYPASTKKDIPTGVDSGYPAEETRVEEENILPDVLTIPTPSADSGVVSGKLLGKTDDQPYIAPGLYLGKLIRSNQEDSDTPPLIGISTGSDPKAIQANDGTFVFTDVPPGEYVLIIWAPMSIVPITDPETQSELIVTIEAGDAVDLGTVYVD